MESQFLGLPCIKVNHVVVLNPSTTREVINVFGIYIAFVSDVNELEQIDQVEIWVLCEIFS